jgi:hypothetical protein
VSWIRSRHGLGLALGWGAALWFIGYVLGIALYFLVPPSMLGWVIMPIGAALTWIVLWRWVESRRFVDYVVLAVAWTAIAVAGDFFFIVKALHPPDGYYKLDVYLYYVLTFLMPVTAGWLKTRATVS